MKKKKPELNFSPQANMLHLLKSAKSVALSSPKRNTVLLQPSILDVMTGKGSGSHAAGHHSRLSRCWGSTQRRSSLLCAVNEGDSLLLGFDGGFNGISFDL